ncbi:MAG: N-acetyltransferase [Pseudomonadota bacterium]
MNGGVGSCTGIRAAQLADIPDLLALEAEFPTDRLTRAHWRHLLTRGHGLALVFTLEDAVVGNVVLFFRKNSSLARVYSLVVKATQRGKGVARQLMEAAQAEVYQRGLQGLLLEVRVDNVAAQALYARLGYHLERRLHGFYADGSDALRLSKRLVPDRLGAQGLEAAVT